jgi:hypothetical protein
MQRRWIVVARHCHFSAFAGYHYTLSTYSTVKCVQCGATGRTKAAYVRFLPDAPENWPSMNREQIIQALDNGRRIRQAC